MKKKKYKPNLLRKLARSEKWLTLYVRAKEMDGIKLFKNERDFTPLQIRFLRWLEIYHSLYIDLAMKEPYISEEIIEDDIYCDAYLLWKSKNEDKKEEQKPVSDEQNPFNMSVKFV